MISCSWPIIRSFSCYLQFKTICANKNFIISPLFCSLDDSQKVSNYTQADSRRELWRKEYQATSTEISRCGFSFDQKLRFKLFNYIMKTVLHSTYVPCLSIFHHKLRVVSVVSEYYLHCTQIGEFLLKFYLKLNLFPHNCGSSIATNDVFWWTEKINRNGKKDISCASQISRLKIPCTNPIFKFLGL